jgi:poly(ADP-ribose) glycohydrolase ARH3
VEDDDDRQRVARARGAMLGALLGDAFGRPLEGTALTDSGLPDRVERRRRGSDPLGYSDDAEMMIFVAESLVRCGRLNPEHLLRWMAQHHEPARGYGKGTRAALAAAARGVPAADVAYTCWPEGSIGNGAAVRVAPIACLHPERDQPLSEAAAAAARVTHASLVAVESAIVMARATAAVLRAPTGERPSPDAFLASIEPAEPTLAARLASVSALLHARASTREAVAVLGNGVVAVESVPLALFCFLRWGPDFESVIVQTALCGGDVDSIAAMSGALSGASVGEAGLPARWLARAENGCRGRDHVRALADQVCDLARRDQCSLREKEQDPGS